MPTRSSLFGEKANALTLVLERTWRKSEVLPSAVLTVVLTSELVTVEGPVHVGVVDQNGLAARRTVVAHQKNVRHNLTAVSCLCSRPGVVERSAGQLRGVDQADRRADAASYGFRSAAEAVIARSNRGTSRGRAEARHSEASVTRSALVRFLLWIKLIASDEEERVRDRGRS